ncbi:MAG: NAD(P)H-hydrate dehydratase [Clostridium sp.]
MKHLVTGSQMREIDDYAIHTIGIPSMVLMERAALAVVEEIEQARADKGRVLILCGTGNNGADGAAIARMLYLNQWDVTILTVGKNDNRTEEMKSQLAIDDNLGIPIMEFFDFIPGTYDVTVDALFGVGLTRELSGEFKEAVEMVGQLQPKLTVAVDIPSGIHSETGHVMGIAFRADLTVTFGYAKLGTLLYPGKEYSGRIAVRDIGFPEYKENWKHRFYCYDDEDLAFIPSRKPNSHKGMYGKVLIAAGSRGMCGAAYLSALAAYRTGAGLVKILSVEDNVNILQTLLPEAIISSYSPQMEEEEPELFRELIEKECAWAGVIVLGPGLGTGRHVVKLVEYVLLSAYVPIILDADGLNAVAEHPHLADYFTENVIVTPHMGEMSRLLEKEIEEIKNNPVNTAIEYSEQYGVTCVLKDAVSIVAGKDGDVYINTVGNGGMAKAGSGDVLTGMIAGLVAIGLAEDRAASIGVYLHGMAGDAAVKQHGEHSLLARELADSILRED